MSRVIEHMVWKHTSGRTASTRGACPWTRDSERNDWSMDLAGFTVLHPDGTTGLGRPPFLTREDAQAWCDKNPNFKGMSQG
jgi:hypothetical protein